MVGKKAKPGLKGVLVKSRRRGRPRKNQGPRPDIFRYHDIHEFMRDWETHQRKINRDFSLRRFSEGLGFSPSYMPLIFSHTRSLTEDVSRKLARALELNEVESDYFEALRQLSEGQTDEVRQAAMARLQDFWRYRRENAKEFEAYRYLTHWHYVAIREMAGMKEFKLDAEWIRERVVRDVPIANIEEALRFLLDHGLIQKAESGEIMHTRRMVECQGGVYRLAMSSFHHQMLGMAADSITSVEREDRNIISYTMGIPRENFPKIAEIMNRALEEVAALGGEPKDRDAVYHVSFVAFPLAQLKQSKE
ncbi:MAG: TIGR02147 family protein [Bacteriovoracia bacterium]